MQVHADMFAVCDRRHQEIRPDKRNIQSHPAHTALPSLGRQRIRPGMTPGMQASKTESNEAMRTACQHHDSDPTDGPLKASSTATISCLQPQRPDKQDSRPLRHASCIICSRMNERTWNKNGIHGANFAIRNRMPFDTSR